VDFFKQLKENEKDIITLEEFKNQERQLYNEREQLFKKNQEILSIPIRELSNLVNERFIEYFKDNGFITQNNSNENIKTVKSKSIEISLEKTDENCFVFSLVKMEPDAYSNNLYYTIIIEETEETIYYCTFNGILSEEGKFYYTGNHTGDTVDGVQEQINKLRTDIKKISNITDLPKFVFKLGDHKYSYLNQEFEKIEELFEEILRKFKF
jgi:hypothetical protein